MSATLAPLTPHQSGVIACLIDGMCNKRIAQAMGIEVSTLEDYHMPNIRRSLGLKSTRAICAWAGAVQALESIR
jgi:FixJ family two-component response regulator